MESRRSDLMHGREDSLRVELADAAGARGMRNLEELSCGLDRLAATPDTAALEDLAGRARAMLAMEELLADGAPADACAAGLETFVTRQQIASPAAREVMTSLTDVALAPPTARALFAVVSELVAMVDADAPPDRDLRLFLASEVDDGLLVLAFAARCYPGHRRRDPARPDSTIPRSIHACGADVTCADRRQRCSCLEPS